jgi:predicted NBD/HSP70 family sugar kinase
MFINPEGALFLGLRLGIKHADLILVDFVGEILEQRRIPINDSALQEVPQLTLSAVTEMRSRLKPDQRARLADLGIAVTSNLFDSLARQSEHVGGDSAWSSLEDLALHIGRETALRVYLERDAVAACSSEIAYGSAGSAPDFLYIFVAHTVDGGIVQQGHLGFSRQSGRQGISGVLVPGPQGDVMPLGKLAPFDDAAFTPGMRTADPELAKWIDAASSSLAYAIQSASALSAFRSVVIDGAMPQWVRAELVRTVRKNLAASVVKDLPSLFIREGTSDRQAPALGAACIPLLDRFFLQA